MQILIARSNGKEVKGKNGKFLRWHKVTLWKVPELARYMPDPQNSLLDWLKVVSWRTFTNGDDIIDIQYDYRKHTGFIYRATKID